MTDFKRNPRVLIVTPEVAYLPHGMDNAADYLTAKASGLADVTAALINALFEQGADVYVSIPDYRAMFNGHLPPPLRRELRMFKIRVPEERLHLAEDSAFFYLHGVYSNYWWENRKRALAFQREIINTVIPYVQPDLIHCYDCIDKCLAVQYGPQNHAEGKKKNKRMLQKRLSLIQDDRAPLFFWPSPLNTVHQGCQLLADILFIFEVYNSQGLFWGIRQAMKFYKLSAQVRQQIVERIMTQSAGRFNHVVTARRYIKLYENMLQRPLINSGRET